VSNVEEPARKSVGRLGSWFEGLDAFRMRKMIPRIRASIGQQSSRASGVTGVIPAAATGTEPLYSSTMQNLPPRSLSQGKSLLWWRHPFYRWRWKQWRLNWQKLSDRTPAGCKEGPAGGLRSLKEAHCDPDVALRLAFLVASEKPATKSELARQNERQQRIKRKLSQARNYLLKAAFGLMNAALPELANGDKKMARKLAQCRNYLRKAAGELEQALSDVPLIFIKPKDVEALKASVVLTNPQDAALWIRLQDLARMCDHEIETLIWPRAVGLHPGHELFTLVSYFTACSGAPNFSLVTDLLAVANEAYDLARPATDGTTEPLTQDAIEKKVQRFRKLDSIQPGLIEESIAQRAKSGELRRELLACYPD
jgi:hypothetical protein